MSIWATGADDRKIQETIQKGVNAVRSHCETFKLRLSAPKTVGMYFTRDNKDHNIKIKVTEGQNLKWEQKFKFLGIWLTSDLKFRTHCTKIAAKAKHALVLLANIAKKQQLTGKSLRKLAYAYVLGQITFSYPILSFAKPTELRCLESVTDSAARLIVGANRCANGATCGILAGVKPLKLEIKKAVFNTACRASQLGKKCALGKNLQKSIQPAKHKRDFPSFQRTWYIEGGSKEWAGKKMTGFETPCQSFGSNVIKAKINQSLPRMDRSKKQISKTKLKRMAEREIEKISDDDTVLAYTDGSLKQGVAAGAAAYVEDIHKNDEDGKRIWAFYQVALDSRFGNGRAELIAIKLAICDMQFKVKRKTKAKKLAIFTDSKSSLEILSNWELSDDSYVRSLVNDIKDLESNNIEITFQWVPSHVGIAGNEKADRFADEAPLTLIRFSLEIL